MFNGSANELQTQGNKRHAIWLSIHFEFGEFLRTYSSSRKTVLKKPKMIVSRPMKPFIAIDGSDRTSIDESSLHLVRRIFIVRLDLIGD